MTKTFLLVLDCLRYGALTPELMPNLYARASGGVFYERCYSVAGGTIPSAPSIWTGCYPSRHGFLSICHGLSRHAPTLVTRFEPRPIVGVTQNGIMTPRMNIGARALDWIELPADSSVKAALIAARVESRPPDTVFYLHLMATHSPYDAAPSLVQRVHRELGHEIVERGALALMHKSVTEDEASAVREMYYSSARRLDQHLAPLLADEESLFIVTADHGESLGEGPCGTPQWGHHSDWFWRALTHVPLCVFGPSVPRTRIRHCVQNLDVHRIISGEYVLPARQVVFEDYNVGSRVGVYLSEQDLVIEAHRSYMPELERIYKYSTNEGALPDEQHIRAIMAALSEALRTPETREEDDMAEIEKRLRGLGYID